MRLIKFLMMLPGAIVGIVLSASAQDTLTQRDLAIIKDNAVHRVARDYLSLLNGITSTMAENLTIHEVIDASTQDGPQKLFVSPHITVEDDLSSPNFRSSSSSHDVSVDQYLKDWNVFYEKTGQQSIFFNNVRTSNVKKGPDNIFIKVYFTSLFKSRCKASLDTSYVPTNREAELVVKKGPDKHWNVYISRIGFFQPADTVKDRSLDIALNSSDSAGKAPGVTENTAVSKARKKADSVALVQELRRANEKYEQDTKAINALIAGGDEHLADNELDDAKKAYMAASAIRPGDLTVRAKLENLAKLQSGIRLSADLKFGQTIEAASLEEKSRHYQNAIALYTQAIALKPEEATTYRPRITQLQGRIEKLFTVNEKYQKGDYNGAVAEYNNKIAVDKTNSDLYLGRGKCYLKMGDGQPSRNKFVKLYNLALDDFEASYTLDNNNLETIRRMAETLRKKGRPKEAVGVYKQFLLISKSDTSVYNDLAKTYLELYRNLDSAVVFVGEAIVTQPRNAILYYEQGLLYERMKDFVKSGQSFANVVRIDSTNARAFFHAGVSAVVQHTPDVAARNFAQARHKGLDSVYAPAVNEYRQYLASKSKDAPAAMYFDLGALALKDHRYDSAGYFLTMALARDSTDGNTLYAQGVGLYYGGKTNEAYRCFERAFASRRLEKTMLESGLPVSTLFSDKRFKDLREQYHY